MNMNSIQITEFDQIIKTIIQTNKNHDSGNATFSTFGYKVKLN
jgi:hypothetical protein